MTVLLISKAQSRRSLSHSCEEAKDCGGGLNGGFSSQTMDPGEYEEEPEPRSDVDIFRPSFP